LQPHHAISKQHFAEHSGLVSDARERSAVVRPSGSPRSIAFLADPVAEGLVVDAEFAGNVGDGAVLVEDHARRVLRGTGSGSDLVDASSFNF
jgi:hypothetical protein